jgi:hypothetical protein
MYQQLWGFKVEEKLYLGVREQKSLNTTALQCLQSDVTRRTQLPHQRVLVAEVWLYEKLTLGQKYE